MSNEQRMMRLLTANPQTLAKVDAVLDGTDGGTAKADPDCRTCTFAEASRRGGWSRPTTYRLVERGVLKTVELNGVRRIVGLFEYCLLPCGISDAAGNAAFSDLRRRASAFASGGLVM